jgi:hypothetical protein
MANPTTQHARAAKDRVSAAAALEARAAALRASFLEQTASPEIVATQNKINELTHESFTIPQQKVVMEALVQSRAESIDELKAQAAAQDREANELQANGDREGAEAAREVAAYTRANIERESVVLADERAKLEHLPAHEAELQKQIDDLRAGALGRLEDLRTAEGTIDALENKARLMREAEQDGAHADDLDAQAAAMRAEGRTTEADETAAEAAAVRSAANIKQEVADETVVDETPITKVGLNDGEVGTVGGDEVGVHVDRTSNPEGGTVTPGTDSAQDGPVMKPDAGPDVQPSVPSPDGQPTGAAPTGGISPEKSAFIREEIAKGNHVSIGPDGVPASIEPSTPATPEQIQKNLEAFDHDVSSGKLNGELAQGHSFKSNPDGSGGYSEPERSTDETAPPDGSPDGQPQPADDGQPGPSADDGHHGPSAAELREMTEKYSNAAQALHKQRVDAKMPDEGYEKNMDSRLELKGLRSQLEETTKARTEWPADIKKHHEAADQLNHEATQLDRQGKSKEAEEKREEADLESGTATGLERALTEVNEREATIKARIETVEKDMTAYSEGSAGRRQQQDQLEGTADKLDDSARAMGDAYRARLDADDLRVQAAQAGNEGKADVRAQLEQQAQAADARANQLLQQARQLVPQDDVARKALDEAGVVQEPPVSPPAADAQPDATGQDTQTPDAGATGDVAGDTSSNAEGGATGDTEGSGAPAPTRDAEAGTGDLVGDEEPTSPAAAGATAEGAGMGEGGTETAATGDLSGQPVGESNPTSPDGSIPASTATVEEQSALATNDETGSSDAADPGAVWTSSDDGSDDMGGHDAFEEQPTQPMVAYEDQEPAATPEAEGEYV